MCSLLRLDPMKYSIGRWAAVLTFTVAIPCVVIGKSKQMSGLEYYSENVKAQDQASTGILSESRLRYFPVNSDRIHPYLGGYTNSFQHGPLVGLLASLSDAWPVELMAEQRWLYNDQQNGQPETRWGLLGGGWRELAAPWFSESYFEGILIPRTSKTPVSTLWTRLFYRLPLLPAVVLDPYVQLWVKFSANPDLGEGGLELRPGLRLAWNPPAASLGLFIYHREKMTPQTPSEWEGMLVLSGELK